jgi:ribosome-associated protein
MQIIPFELRAEFITLDRLLKATGLASSGGGAKTMVAGGKIQVDGRDELRKTAKLRAGQVVSLAGTRIRLLAAGSLPPVADDAVDVPSDGSTDSPSGGVPPV